MSNASSITIGRLQSRGSRPFTVAERTSLRVSATLLFVGVLLSAFAGYFHPDREPANTHSAVFAEYAHSGSWTLIHLGQFAGIVVFIAGLLVLFVALNAPRGMSGWAAQFGVGAAVAALALYGVLQAVDGVALKQAVDAWAHAPDAEKAARFASAETIRWLEWAVRSYYSFMFGLALLLFATAIVGSARMAKFIGYLMGLSGLAYLVQGWVLGTEGFSANNSLPTLLGIILVLAWSISLLISAWRMKATDPTPAR